MAEQTGICMLTGAYHPEISGGGMQCYHLVRALEKRFKFFVITTCKDRDYSIVNGILRVYVGRESLLSKIAAPLKICRAFLKIRNEIDIMHIHGYSRKSVLLIMLSKLFGKKVIIKITSIGYDNPSAIKNNGFHKINYYFYSLADFFIVVSPSLRQEYAKAGLPKTKLYFIPNGVDMDRFRPPLALLEKESLKKELGLPLDKKIIVFVGFFSHLKGIDLLIDAWVNNRRQWSDKASLVIIGTKDYRYYYYVDKGMVENIDKKTRGIVSDSKNEIIFVDKTLSIEKYYKAADIFILSSRIEGLPNALLEAMSCGLACVATRLEGITDYMIDDEKEGLLFTKDSSQDLAQKVSVLLNDEEFCRQLGDNARRKVSNKFSIDKISDTYAGFYGMVK